MTAEGEVDPPTDSGEPQAPGRDEDAEPALPDDSDRDRSEPESADGQAGGPIAPMAAESPGSAVTGGTTFYAYVGAGESLDALFAKAFELGAVGSDTQIRITDPSGAVRHDCTIQNTAPNGAAPCDVTGLTGPAGVWSIEVIALNGNPANWPESGTSFFDWEISVQDGAGADVPGRVWTEKYRGYDWQRDLNPDVHFWVVTEHGSQYTVDLYDFNGGGWAFDSNAFGVAPTGTCAPAYQSIEMTTNTPEYPSAPASCGDPYKLFFEPPDPNLPATAPGANGTEWVLPPVVTPTIDNLQFGSVDTDTREGTFTYDLTDFTGTYSLQIDANGDGDYDDPVDRVIPLSGSSGSQSYSWDGLDGNGDPIGVCQEINARVAIDRIDEIHFVLGDTESLGGITIEQLIGNAPGETTIYWDDTQIIGTPPTTPIDGTAGVESDVPGGVHGWAFNWSDSWGNQAAIDNWTYSAVDVAETLTVPSECFEIEKISDATADSRPGDVITYEVTMRNTGTATFTASNPARLFDDLTGVIDDATYNNDATADRGPTPSYSAPIISWEGPLAPNEMVTITYTVTLQGGGDGEVRNVAFTPLCDPAEPDCDTTTPVCDPPDDEGRDPDTGLPCAEHEFELPRLQIDKVADVTELPGVGETVTYTVTATNVGPGVYTPTAPAPVTDDLTDVIDDATYNNDATADRGPTPSYSAPIISWEGPLAVGETVTITYTVTYTGAGDHILVNTACVPDDQVVVDDDPCASVQIPAAFIEDSKAVEASDDPLVAGSTLTYTLTFENTGEAAGTVDKVDNLLHVLDDADVTVQPVVDPAGGLTVSPIANGQFSITGTLDPDEVVTVTYTVTIRPEGERGDNVAANFLLLPTDPAPCDPAEEDCTVPPCEPAPGELPDCTTTPIGEIEDGKSVVASDDPLVAGSTLTYTLTFENTGNADAAVDKVDNLLHVLDDADVTVQPASSDPSKLTVSAIAGGEFSITGTLEPGDIVTVTYTVTIKPEGERGDNQANNYLVEPGTDICDPATDEDCAPPPCIPAIGELPDCTVTPLGEIVDSKAVEASDDPLVTGSTLTYTLTFENVGNADAVVDKVDNLLHVLDDADVTLQPVVDPAGALTASPIASGEFSITGTLQPGEIVTVTYEVTIKPEGERGDNVAANFLLLPTDPAPCDPADPDCVTPPCEPAPGELPDCTTTPIGEIEDGKSVVASDDPVVAGTVLTYALTFENVGNADAPVDKVDSLLHVLDDGDVTAQPVVDPAGELAVSPITNGEFSITGTLQPGEIVTVTYEVTIRPDGERGDDLAANYLIEPGEEICDPADEDCEQPPCVPTPGELPDCTVTPVGEVIDSKTVEASDDPLTAGSTLTYTLTFENTGQGPAPVSKIDNLLHVLDDADVTTPPAVDPAGELTVSPIQNGQFTITGTLDPGEVVTVTYTVTLKPDGERGDNVAANYLIEPGEVICDPADKDCEPPVCEPAEGELPDCTITPIPELEDWKEVVASDDPLVAGSTLTYTLTFTNTGEAAGNVDKIDYLLHVLDDAEVTSEPVADPDGILTVSPIANGQFTITGTLDPGDIVTVTYEVTLKPDGERGDNQAVNFLLPPIDAPPCDPADEDCVVPPCEPAEGEQPDCTVTPIPQIEDSKSVDPASTTPVTGGQELTYTLTFTNTGEAAGLVDRVDDLTHVLDDADLVSGPTPSDPALAVTGPDDEDRIHITGELAPDQTVTVTYTVVVKDAEDRGDDVLANFLLDPEEEPPTEPVCEPAEGEEPDCTTNPVGDLAVDKSVDPESGTEVAPGDELTYTLTFTNTGKGETTVEHTDHAAGLLDDAVLVDGPTASDQALAVTGPDDDLIHVTGALAGGQTVTVTYTVEVKPHDELSDGLLENFLTPTGEEPPTECAETNPLCTENPVEPPADEPPAEEPPGDEPSADEPPGNEPPGDDDLPDTGTGLGTPTLLSGMALLAGGLALLAATRRRNQAAGERSVNPDDLI
ncbi:DUF11 domain-containing protein [Jiangella gansuensis]|uniref:DUF7927 domain-containing protein n=1 Tax=Jiangella gansuensis TaxID=281473 RepID=UPI00146FB373|nr:DUF11 domain-containing protein [Jiangella gansuensis]